MPVFAAMLLAVGWATVQDIEVPWEMFAYYTALIAAMAMCFLGFGMLIARWHRWALVGSIALSLAYLALGTLLTPALWADPLGPFAKVVPVIGLALALLARGDER